MRAIHEGAGHSGRRRRAFGILLLAGAAILGVFTASGDVNAQAPLPDRVAGHVVQGTADAPVPEGLQVGLQVMDADGNLVTEMSDRVDATGAYSFADLPAGEGYGYQLTVVYGGLRRTVAVEDALDPENIDLNVYETTSELDDVSVTTHAMIVPRADGRSRLLGVLELVEIANTGDRVFIANLADATGGMPRLLRFGLPEGYQDLSVESDLPTGRVLEIDRGFALTNAIPPGNFQLLFSYAVEYQGNTFEYVRAFPYGAGEVRVLLPSQFGIVSGDGLVADQDTQLGETQYRVVRGSGFARGARVSIRFTGLPQPTFIERVANFTAGSAWTTIGIPLIAAAAMAALLAYVFVFRRRPAEAAAEAGPRAEIVAKIAELDDRYDAGKLSDEEYDRARADLTGKALDQPPGPDQD